MHVIDALRSDFYEVEVGGKPATAGDVFPGWNEHDRFGIIVYEPLALIGATHLIQMACMCFYDAKPIRRTERKIYPEIFAIHVGDWWGGHGNFDFWPPRREARVANDHRDVLGAINDRGITRLVIPERPVRDITHRRKEEDCALDRLVTTVIYNPSGRVAAPDFTIASNSPRSERDVVRTIRPSQRPELIVAKLRNSPVPVKEGDLDFAPRQAELNIKVTDSLRDEVEKRRARLGETGQITESYRFMRPEASLKCL